MSLSKEQILKIIDDWQGYWMNQTQNNEADYQNYFRRAMGVDANMRHSLAKRIESALKPICEHREAVFVENKNRESWFECEDCGKPVKAKGWEGL